MKESATFHLPRSAATAFVSMTLSPQGCTTTIKSLRLPAALEIPVDEMCLPVLNEDVTVNQKVLL